MLSPAEIIQDLVSIHHMTEEAIAAELKKQGISVTQATINRIKTGAHKSTRFDIGMGLTRLHERRSKGRARTMQRLPESHPA